MALRFFLQVSSRDMEELDLQVREYLEITNQEQRGKRLDKAIGRQNHKEFS
jgi:hypothetical protein